MTKLLDPSDVADILQVTRAQVVRLANRGVLPSIRLPTGDRRFLESDIAAWIEAHRAAGERAGREVAP